MARRRRQLTAEEKALWDQVASTTTRLAPEEPTIVPEEPVRALSHRAAPAPAPIPRFRVGAKVDLKPKHNIAAPIQEALAAAPVSMDHKTHRKMTKGKLSPDARIDLHGMTLNEAHGELTHFILSSHEKGHRLVLVITGKGKDRDEGGPIPTRMGVLRHQVPQWLRLPPLGRLILQTTPAHLKHGGHGAYYVYLRRSR